MRELCAQDLRSPAGLRPDAGSSSSDSAWPRSSASLNAPRVRAASCSASPAHVSPPMPRVTVWHSRFKSGARSLQWFANARDERTRAGRGRPAECGQGVPPSLSLALRHRPPGLAEPWERVIVPPANGKRLSKRASLGRDRLTAHTATEPDPRGLGCVPDAVKPGPRVCRTEGGGCRTTGLRGWGAWALL